MALKVGIVGLPNVGKSTLFNALTESMGAQAENFPFCTIEPNVGVVEVPDERLQALADLVSPEKVIPTNVEFVDIAGLVKGASKGEGLGNQFLAAIRESHAICHVVRVFDDSDVTHVDGSVDAKRDRDTIETELILADLESVQKRLEKNAGAVRSGDKDIIKEQELLEQAKVCLESGSMLSCLDLPDDDQELMKGFHLLSSKPILYVANVSEDQLGSLDAETLKSQMGLGATDELILVSAKVEQELQELAAEERSEYLEGLGITSSGLDLLIHAAYRALGYITYFTAGPKEVRAWTIQQGMTAPQAAGVIHTDFERGFIRAETIAYADYIGHQGEQGAKTAGKMRSEGKDYIVQDGDVMLFKFNV